MIGSKRHIIAEQQLITGLEIILGSQEKPVPLHAPTFGPLEKKFLIECVDTGWVSSAGDYVTRFEDILAEYTSAKHAIAVVNGTAALQIGLMLVGVRPGDEVIIPSLSFVATANAVAHCGATPHFVDCSPTTLGMDSNKLGIHLGTIAEFKNGKLINTETGAKIAAIVPMHTFGHPINLSDLLKVSRTYDLPIVEDAAEALGSTYDGQHLGTFGEIGALSFNGNKIITTGGGGAILTNNSDIAEKARHITTTAKTPHQWAFYHDEIGYNYRMPNINAALGCAQMDLLPKLLENKRQLAQEYSRVFKDASSFSIISEPCKAKSNYWLNAIKLENSDLNTRDAILNAVHAKGYLCRPVWNALHALPMFKNCPKSNLCMTEKIETQIINIPSSAHLLGWP